MLIVQHLAQTQRFRLASEGWLDPSTVRFFFDKANTDANSDTKFLRPLGKCHAFFRRFRALVRGMVVEYSFDHKWVSDMFHILQNSEAQKRINASHAIDQMMYWKSLS
jgi:hypothetical protein